MAPRDQAENLRRRLVALIDLELERLERRRNKRPADPIDAEQLRKLARALRELALLPAPGEPRLPRAPGAREADGSLPPDSTTRDSLAGAMLRTAGKHAPGAAQTGAYIRSPGEREQAGDASETTDASDDAHDNTHGHDDDGHEPDDRADGRAPGSRVRSVDAGLAADGVAVART